MQLLQVAWILYCKLFFFQVLVSQAVEIHNVNKLFSSGNTLEMLNFILQTNFFKLKCLRQVEFHNLNYFKYKCPSSDKFYNFNNFVQVEVPQASWTNWFYTLETDSK